nr:hypothetical protein [Prevotella sp.]
MSENQIIHGDECCQMENNIDKVENLVVEPKNFNNYHNSIVVNLTVNVTGDVPEEEISRIIKTATASLSIEFKKIMRTNFDGEHQAETPTYQLEGDVSAIQKMLTEINQKTDLEQKSSCVFISHSHHFRRDDLTLSQVIFLCSQISKK